MRNPVSPAHRNWLSCATLTAIALLLFRQFVFPGCGLKWPLAFASALVTLVGNCLINFRSIGHETARPPRPRRHLRPLRRLGHVRRRHRPAAAGRAAEAVVHRQGRCRGRWRHLTILVGKEQHRIRLEGIDCPESRQDFGTKAKEAIAGKVFGKEVTIKWKARDKYRVRIAIFSKLHRIPAFRCRPHRPRLQST